MRILKLIERNLYKRGNIVCILTDRAF